MAQGLTESDIRPADLFDAYLDLVAKDIQTYFDASIRSPIPCPACNHPGDYAFTKVGFEYRDCPTCHSLWVSPRPPFADFSAFYSESVSAEYWAEVFSPAVQEVRRERLWRPKAHRVARLVSQWEAVSTPFRSIVDIGGGTGIFAEEFEKITSIDVVVVEPSPAAAASCRARKIAVLETFLEDLTKNVLPDGPTVFTSFELFEHVHDPIHWLTSISRVMEPGDLLLLSTLSSTGVDIRVLWENSASVNPPHHINFFNPGAMRLLSTRCGLDLLDIFTPGELDIDILRNNPSLIRDRFWSWVITTDDDTRLRWQSLIAEAGASSHMWVVMQKPVSSDRS